MNATKFEEYFSLYTTIVPFGVETPGQLISEQPEMMNAIRAMM